jgi:DNA-binding NarL/FixJ family response regulator
MTNFNSEPESVGGRSWNLTRSELLCLSLTASGMCIETVAKQLKMSIRELELVFYCAQRKLNAENRMHAICIAISLGLISD